MYPSVHPYPIFFDPLTPAFQASRSGVTSASAASVQGNMKARRDRKGWGGEEWYVCIFSLWYVCGCFFLLGFLLGKFCFEGSLIKNCSWDFVGSNVSARCHFNGWSLGCGWFVWVPVTKGGSFVDTWTYTVCIRYNILICMLYVYIYIRIYNIMYILYVYIYIYTLYVYYVSGQLIWNRFQICFLLPCYCSLAARTYLHHHEEWQLRWQWFVFCFCLKPRKIRWCLMIIDLLFNLLAGGWFAWPVIDC